MAVALQMLIVLGLPTAIVILALQYRHRERLRVLDLVEASAAQDRPLTPEVIRTLPGAKASAANLDLRRGVLLISIGIAAILMGICALIGVATSGGEGAVAIGVGIAGVGAIPLCIGIALVVLSRADSLLTR